MLFENLKRSDIMAQINCPECGAENASDTAQCSACGYPLSKIRICPDCSHANAENAEKCEHCGCPLKQEKKIKTIRIKPKILAVVMAIVIAVTSISVSISNDKKELKEKLVSGSLWDEAGTTAKISFREDGKIVYSIINVSGGIMGDMNYLLIHSVYEVKPGNRIKIGDKTLKVIFTQAGKIDFEPSLRPVITEAANNSEKGE